MPVSSLLAQQSLHFNNFDVEDGLSNSSVTDVYRASDGMVWVATQDGVSRFDGAQWQVFRKSIDDPASLYENYTVAVCEPSTKLLWVSTLNGIAVLEKRSMQQIDTISTRSSISQMKPGARWVMARSSSGLHIFDLQGKPIREFLTPGGTTYANVFLLSGNSALLLRDRSLTRIEVYLQNEELKISETEFTFPESLDPKQTIGYLSSSKVLVRDYRHMYVWSIIDEGNTRLDQIFTDPKISREDELVSEGLLMPDGSFWMYSYQKLWYVQKDESYVPVLISDGADLQRKNPIKYPVSAHLDEYQILWFAGNGTGVTAIDTRQLIFKTMDWTQNPGFEAFKASVWASAWNRERDQVVFCTDEGAFSVDLDRRLDGLGPWDLLSASIQNLRKLPVPKQPYPIVDVIPKNGHFYLNQLRYGILDYDPVNNTVEKIYDTPEGKHVYSGEKVGNSIYWGGSKNFLEQDARNRFSYVWNPNDLRVNIQTIYASRWDEERNAILISSNSGAFQYNIGPQTLEAIVPFESVRKRVGTAVFFGTNRVDDRYLAASFGKGLFEISATDTIIYALEQGLENESLYDVVSDASARIWLPSNRGLHLTDAALSHFTVFNQKFGLDNVIFNQNGSFEDGSNLLSFSGTRGFVFINSSHLQEVFRAVPAVQIADLSWIDSNGRERRQYALEGTEISFGQDAQSIRLRASIPDLHSDRYRVQYRWNNESRWLPLDMASGWISIDWKKGTRQTLHIRQSNLLGTWIPETRSIAVNLSIPFLNRTSVRIALLLFGIALMSGISVQLVRNFYQRRLERLNRERERLKEREVLSRDLHDSIGTQLSLIMHHIGNASKQGKAHQRYLDSAMELAQRSIEQLRETLWVLKKEETTLKNLGDRIDRLVLKTISGSDINYEFQADVKKDVIVGPVKMINVLRIVEESVANVVKYSQTERLLVHVKSEKNGWSLLIRDFGVGFDLEEASEKESYGLRHMRSRAEELGGTLEIVSSPGGGCQIALGFPF